jgi:hypothetical protein
MEVEKKLLWREDYLDIEIKILTTQIGLITEKVSSKSLAADLGKVPA